MTLAYWIPDTSDRIRSDPPGDTAASLYELDFDGLRRANALYAGSEHIYCRDWDALILLDTCRVDLVKEAHDEHPFLDIQKG